MLCRPTAWLGGVRSFETRLRHGGGDKTNTFLWLTQTLELAPYVNRDSGVLKALIDSCTVWVLLGHVEINVKEKPCASHTISHFVAVKWSNNH
jgi:hypothetical protein